jgi:hypothetical protein
MTDLKDCDNCEGCKEEIWECYIHQQLGYNSGLEFWKGHVFFYVIDPKTDEFIVPCYDMRYRR